VHVVPPSQEAPLPHTLTQPSGSVQPTEHLPAATSAFFVPNGQPQSVCELHALAHTPLIEHAFDSQSPFALQAAPIGEGLESLPQAQAIAVRTKTPAHVNTRKNPI